ncbi:MAG: M56 family metallopeptidase [Aequorivita sp.]|nr:M56 family metallopeptidase [Aequorivita sp.]
MEIYVLKSAAILTVLFAFYKVFLENTSIHNFKRFYLFGSLLAAFLIPLITFTSYVEVSPIVATYTEATPQVTHTEIEKNINYWPFVLWTIYGLGALFFGIIFFRNLFNLMHQIRKNPKYKNTPFINVLLNETVIPHTFFNYIFLNKKQFENREIPTEVIFHEETHARQKHSLDIVFATLLQIVFWFNPLFYFIKKSIKLNHEFLADRAVLKTGAKISEYQKILLAFSSNAATPSLAHSLNYSSIKKRFTLMKTHTSKRAIWLKSLLILPLLSILIYGFSTRTVVEKEVSIQKTESVLIQQKDTIRFNGEIIQQKATEAEIAEYNKLAKKYNAVAIENRKIPLEDLKILETIYRKMTDEQKVNAEPFPECLPPSPPKPPKAPEAPKVKEGEKSDIPPPPPAPKIAKSTFSRKRKLISGSRGSTGTNCRPCGICKGIGETRSYFLHRPT